jgi:hypothetical protein
MMSWIKSEKLVDLNYDGLRTELRDGCIKLKIDKNGRESQGRLRLNSMDCNATKEEDNSKSGQHFVSTVLPIY